MFGNTTSSSYASAMAQWNTMRSAVSVPSISTIVHNLVSHTELTANGLTINAWLGRTLVCPDCDGLLTEHVDSDHTVVLADGEPRVARFVLNTEDTFSDCSCAVCSKHWYGETYMTRYVVSLSMTESELAALREYYARVGRAS